MRDRIYARYLYACFCTAVPALYGLLSLPFLPAVSIAALLLVSLTIVSVFDAQPVIKCLAACLYLCTTVWLCSLESALVCFLPVWILLRLFTRLPVPVPIAAAVGFLGAARIAEGCSLAQLLLDLMLLTLLCGGLTLPDLFAARYADYQSSHQTALSRAAVSEMKTRQMNQALLMRNYLSDRNARLEERETISRNIHNNVGHTITAAIMTLDAADTLFDVNPAAAREKMRAANARIHGSLEAIRHAVRVLDKDVCAVAATDLARELTDVANAFQMDAGVTLHHNFTDAFPDTPIPHEHTEFLVGAVGELLANGVRHGHASVFHALLKLDARHVLVSVSDNGCGSQTHAAELLQCGYGLKKLQAYLSRCGGSLQVDGSSGFSVTITLPLPENGGNGND